MTFPWLFHDPIPFSMTKKGRDANDSNAANQVMYSLIQYLMQIVPCEIENTAWSYQVFSKTILSKNILNPLLVLLAHHSKIEVP